MPKLSPECLAPMKVRIKRSACFPKQEGSSLPIEKDLLAFQNNVIALQLK